MNRILRLLRTTNVLFFFTVLVLIFLRIYAIGERPFHNDEGVNFYFVKNVLANGIYNYSHENYHGPTYFYLLSAVSSIFGINDFSQRFASAIPSIILFFVCYSSFYYLRDSVKLHIIILLGISTTFLYYSRYSIHETLLVLSCMLGLHYFTMAMIFKKDRYWIYLLCSAALAISTKETFIIHFASLVFCSLLVFPIRLIWSEITKKHESISWGIFLFFFIIALFYSGFFKSAEGLRELFMGVPQWLGRGHSDVGHHKPYRYYFDIMKRLEPVCLLGVFPLIDFFIACTKNIKQGIAKLLLKKKFFSVDTLFAVIEYPSCQSSSVQVKCAYAFSLYGLASFLAYSYVPYKTPWLIINITVPLLISFGIWLPYRIPSRVLCHVIQTVIIVISLFYSLRYNYSEESLVSGVPMLTSEGIVGDKNPLAYVHTQNGMIELSNEISEYIRKKKGVRILIGIDSYWPLPYYLRDYDAQLMYAPGSDPRTYFSEYDIIIANKEKVVDMGGWRSKYLRLSDNQESMIYFKNLN